MDNNSFKVQGTIIAKGAPATFGTFTKAELVLSISDGKYEQKVTFDVSGKALDRLDNYAVGQAVEVSFNLRGREYTPKDGGETKYFNNLAVWYIGEADDFAL